MRRQTIACLLATLAMTGHARAQPARPRPEISGQRPSASRLAEAETIRSRLGLTPGYDNVAGVESVKVAVLDFGFEGVGSGRPYLPPDAVVVEHYDPEFVRRFRLGDPAYRKPFEPGNRHGRDMAQIVWGVTGSRPRGPKFYLLNANGPTMLRRAVHYAIEQRVDIILFSGSFEGGGNGDGRGPINFVADAALAADIVWINAAGNYGGGVYNGPVRLLADGFLRLRDGSDVAALRFRNRLDENTITVTLTWNDYRAEEDAGTTKDLDLYVEDWAGRRVGSGRKVQVGGDHIPGPDESRNPRERVVLTGLPAVPDVPSDPDYCYRIRVKAKAGRFTTADRIRVLVTAARDGFVATGDRPPVDAVEFLDASGEGELFPPADNPRVLTVGDTDPTSSIGPTLDRRVKPEVLIDDSRAFFTDGQVSAGSSNAAAYFAGVVAVMKAAEPALRTRHLVRLAREGPAADHGGAGRPASRDAAGPGRPPRPASALRDLHLWQTPSRSRLASAVRVER